MNAQTALLGVALALSAAELAWAQPRPAAAPTTVSFRNDLPPGGYELRRVRLWVDGELRYDGPGAFRLPVPPGEHVVSVAADYRMNDPIFTYVRSYGFAVQSAQRVDSAMPHAWVARAVEVGGVTTPVERRAAILWR
jgi:hypothetical protein